MEWVEKVVKEYWVSTVTGGGVLAGAGFVGRWVLGWFQRIIDEKDKTIRYLKEQIKSERSQFETIDKSRKDFIEQLQRQLESLSKEKPKND